MKYIQTLSKDTISIIFQDKYVGYKWPQGVKNCGSPEILPSSQIHVLAWHIVMDVGWRHEIPDARLRTSYTQQRNQHDQ